MAFVTDAEVLTTTDAAKLVGRSIGSVRRAIDRGVLPSVGHTYAARPLVSRAALLRWHQEHPPMSTRRISGTYERTALALRTLGPSDAPALADYLGIHPGNVRKHLAYLAREGRAQRGADGLWMLTVAAASGAA